MKHKDMKIKLGLLLFLLCVTLCPAWAQSFSVTGTVVDEQSEPVIGASILVKGTNRGMITDMDGKFHLNDVRASDVLVVSFVGLQTQEVKAKERMRIVLTSTSEELDEVIVTAFGTAKKSAFTGSATVLNKATIEKKQVTNVLQTLAGEVPGLQMAPSTAPGSTSSILIRGEGSINAGTDPLIVLDGMIYEGGWNNINPQDVESITVLKDAASNALYGARGANGVIIITTKKGEAGKGLITVDAKWGGNSRGLPDYDRITNPGEYYEMYYQALYDNYVSKGSSALAAHQKANENLFGDASVGGLGYNIYTVPDGEYLIGSNGKLNPNATLGRRIYQNGQVYTLYPDDWTDEAYGVGLRQEYNLSISGGSNNAQLYSSFGYLKDEGIVDASDYERFTARLRANYQAKPWLLFGANVSYTRGQTHNVYNDGSYNNSSVFTQVSNTAPIYPMYVRDGEGNIMSDNNGILYDWGNGVYNENSIIRPFCNNVNNVNSLLIDYSGSKSNAVNTDAFVDISFLKDFKFSFKVGTSLLEERASSTTNPFYGYYAQQGGTSYVSHVRAMTLNLQQVLNWTKAFGHHHLNLMVGHESYNYDFESLDATKAGAVDYFGNLELNGYLNSYGIPSSYAEDYNTEGYLFRGMYDYNERYFAQFSYRRDASSMFHPDNRWGNFWSLGGAWIISKEEWFNADWINTLKLKASYGEQGNHNIGYFRYVNTYTTNSVNGDLSLDFNSKGNKEITWEKNGNLNVGVEFELFKHRLNGGVEFYNRTTRDMLMWFSTPTTLGYSGYYQNVGDMRNRGLELTLSGTPIRTRQFEWSLNLNLTYNHQRVTHLDEANKSMTVDGYNGFQQGNDYFIGEGLPLNTFYILKYAGPSEEGASQWYKTDENGNEVKTTNYSEGTYHLIKGQSPVYGGFGTTISAFGFDLSAQFTYNLGGKGYDAQYAYLMSSPYSGVTGSAIHADLRDAWSVDNTDSNIPRFQFGDEYTGIISDRYLISKTYLNLQNMQLGYTVPAVFTAKLGLSKLRLYVTGDNLYLWSKRKGYDPRTSSGYGVYSPMRTISGGVNLQF